MVHTSTLLLLLGIFVVPSSGFIPSLIEGYVVLLYLNKVFKYEVKYLAQID